MTLRRNRKSISTWRSHNVFERAMPKSQIGESRHLCTLWNACAAMERRLRFRVLEISIGRTIESRTCSQISTWRLIALTCFRPSSVVSIVDDRTTIRPARATIESPRGDSSLCISGKALRVSGRRPRRESKRVAHSCIRPNRQVLVHSKQQLSTWRSTCKAQANKVVLASAALRDEVLASIDGIHTVDTCGSTKKVSISVIQRRFEQNIWLHFLGRYI